MKEIIEMLNANKRYIEDFVKSFEQNPIGTILAIYSETGKTYGEIPQIQNKVQDNLNKVIKAQQELAEKIEGIFKFGVNNELIITKKVADEMLRKVEEEQKKTREELGNEINAKTNDWKNYLRNKAEALKNAIKEHDENTNNQMQRLEERIDGKGNEIKEKIEEYNENTSKQINEARKRLGSLIFAHHEATAQNIEGLKKHFDQRYFGIVEELNDLANKYSEELGDFKSVFEAFLEYSVSIGNKVNEVLKQIKTEGRSTRGHVTRWSKKIIYELKELEKDYQTLANLYQNVSQSVERIPEIHEKLLEYDKKLSGYGKVLEEIKSYFPIDQSKEDTFQRNLGEYGIGT